MTSQDVVSGPARGFLSYAVDPRGQSWPVALISVALYVPLSVAIIRSQADPGSSVAVSLGALLAYAFQWLLLAGARRTFLRQPWSGRHPRTTVLAIVVVILIAGLLVSAVAGLSRSSLLSGLDAAAGPVEWLGRSAIFLVVTSIWAAFADYRTGLAAARALTEQLEREREFGVARVEGQRREVIGTISEWFEDAVGTDTTGGRVDLTALARERLRPLSHELAMASPPYAVERPAVPRPAPWREVADEITRHPIIQPVVMALVVTVLFALSTVTQVDTVPEGSLSTSVDAAGSTVSVSVDLTSLLWNLGYLIGIFLVTLLAGVVATRVLRSRLPHLPLGRRSILLVVTLMVMAAVVELAIVLSYYTPGFAAEQHTGVGGNLAVTASIFVIALVILSTRVVAQLFTSITRTEEQLADQLAWEIARANETLAQERRHLATVLHGPVQSGVIAAGMTFQQDLADGVSADRAWASATDRLDAIVQSLDAGPSTERSLDEELSELQDTWAGLCTINAEIPEHVEQVLAADWVGAATVSDLIIEAVGNAAMHGRARTVQVSLRDTDDFLLHLSVIDDGVPEEGSGSPGLGSSTLDQVAVRWHREVTPSGTTLDVWLPLLATQELAVSARG